MKNDLETLETKLLDIQQRIHDVRVALIAYHACLGEDTLSEAHSRVGRVRERITTAISEKKAKR